MNIKPLGNYVLIEQVAPIAPADVKKSPIILPGDAEPVPAGNQAIVRGVGPDCAKDRFSEGDRVLVNVNRAANCFIPGRQLYLLLEADVLAVISEE